MINTLNSSIRKQISDKAAKLAYFRCFFGHPHPYLIWAKDAKGVEGAEKTFTKNTSIDNISAKSTFIWAIFTNVIFYISTELFDIGC